MYVKVYRNWFVELVSRVTATPSAWQYLPYLLTLEYSSLMRNVSENIVSIYVLEKETFLILIRIFWLVAPQEGFERIVIQATSEDSEEKGRRFWREG
jgi:hypothetical protein